MGRKNGILLTLIIPAILLEAGCYTPTQPASVTLKDALVSSVDAMYAANLESRRLKHTYKLKQGLGLAVCQLNAKFLIDVKNSTEDKLALSAGPAPAVILPVPLSLSASTDFANTDERSNTVTVLYTSKDCAMKTAGTPDPNKGSGG